jgi:hypothetical protein
MEIATLDGKTIARSTGRHASQRQRQLGCSVVVRKRGKRRSGSPICGVVASCVGMLVRSKFGFGWA